MKGSREEDIGDRALVQGDVMRASGGSGSVLTWAQGEGDVENFQASGVGLLHVCRYFHLVKFLLIMHHNLPKDVRGSMTEHACANPFTKLWRHTLTQSTFVRGATQLSVIPTLVSTLISQYTQPHSYSPSRTHTHCPRQGPW